MTPFHSPKNDLATGFALGDAGYWQPRVALALDACKNKASDASVMGVAKQLARLSGAAQMLRAHSDLAGTDASSDRVTRAAADFTQALTACSGT